ncbi:MAG: glycosyltransferase family 4 protein [Magnetococcales bacterium]|nr:glycosyltransferase family 4 protein [Magnetococcales bacterium]
MEGMSQAALLFEPDSYCTDDFPLMGRRVAGEQFLAAWLNYAHHADWQIVTAKTASFDLFRQLHARLGGAGDVQWVHPHHLGRVGSSGSLFLPGPMLADWARARHSFGAHAFSVCGITHTIASHKVIDNLAAMLHEPVMPWDALICTSRAVRDAVITLLESQAEYLHARLGAVRWSLPHLPVIPLGVDHAAFQFTHAERQAARRQLGFDESVCVLLFVGRLSFHCKAHPLPMQRALGEAMRQTGRAAALLELGWFANRNQERAFAEGAHAFCPQAQYRVLDGRKAEESHLAWAAADIFCSLADSIQESFGLTPIEAMAAGLPVVVSDWNGYRDTVRDGLDGFLIPVTMPPSGMGNYFAKRYSSGVDNFDYYCGNSSQFIAVDTGACVEAIAKLLQDAELRQRMGENGRQHSKTQFDWPVVLAHYSRLWEKLAEQRQTAAQEAPISPSPVPTRQDPYRLFSSYTPRKFGTDTQVVLAQNVRSDSVMLRQKMHYVQPFIEVLPNAQFCQDLITDLQQLGGSAPVARLMAEKPERLHGEVLMAVASMVKLDILRLVSPVPSL